MTDLAEVDLGKLEASLADWKTVVGRLKDLADRAERGLQAKAESARWTGVNSDVTRAFVGKTAKEFRDAHAEADSIFKVLDDAHSELVGIQNKLKTAIGSEATELGVKVEDYGNEDGAPTIHVFFPHDRTTDDSHTQDELDKAHGLATRIANLVAHAQEIDASVARALQKSYGKDKHDFGHETYTSLDDAEQQRATELDKLGPKMSDKQFTEFNSIMKWNAKDADFTTAFYKSLGGPEKTLEFYGRMSLDGTNGDDKSRLALTKDLQHNMGTALATATDSHNKPHLSDSWRTQFMRLGARSIEIEPGAMYPPRGYQILGGLLRYGDYDPKFINPIAEHIVQLHHKDPDFFMRDIPESRSDLDYGFNPSGKDGAGYDPLGSVLEGLGHSPAAAEQFFSDSYTPTVYNEDGTVAHGKSLGYTYFDELTKKDFKWPVDSLEGPAVAGEDDAKRIHGYGQDALGHALEAATTGVPYGSDGPTPPHSEKGAAIFHNIVERYGTSPTDLNDSPMRDSLGNITADYMRDVQAGYKGDPSTIATHGASAHLESAGPNNTDGISPNALKNFLAAVGKDPDANGAILASQQAVTTELVNGAIKEGHSYGYLSDNVGNETQPGARIAGIMAQSRGDAIYDDQIDDDAKFNEGLGTADKWAGRIIGMGVGKIPVAGDVVGWVTEDVQESVVSNYTRDSTVKASMDKDAYIEGQQASSGQAIYDATKRGALEAGYSADQADTLAEHAKNEALASYGLGMQGAGRK
ncbi:hypothetical protein [Streptomyces sp. NPDC048527]|uniref:hypothetical protein n=1 Tax=Streptomyces sp. NPDC048527 TaxID=3365568 RepID=UPI00371396D6